jgi:hypothetical protein
LQDNDAKPVTRLLRGTFYDYNAGPYNGYLVDPGTGKATNDTFSRDARSFRVHIKDPRSLDPRRSISRWSVRRRTELSSTPSRSTIRRRARPGGRFR